MVDEEDPIVAEARRFIDNVYPRYRGVKLSVEVMEALIKGYLTECAVAAHNEEVRQRAAMPVLYGPPTPAHIHVWVEDHWEAHHIRIA